MGKIAIAIEIGKKKSKATYETEMETTVCAPFQVAFDSLACGA